MFCPKCGKENQSTNKFCKSCGKGLAIQSGPARNAVNTLNSDGLLGQVLDGKYRIEGKLGSGGMGEVYQATRILIGDVIAIKILHPHLADNSQAAERFRREAVTATRLRHPNIVALFDVGISSVHNTPYLLMEYAEGMTLRQLLKQQPKLPLNFIVTLVTQICTALDEAHRLGIIHRDIKPENIIARQTDGGWQVKVLDFGIAKLYDQVDSDLTEDGTAMGTPQYMSPEQCIGKNIDARSDIYSVGIVIYEMLCGAVPFKGGSSHAIAIRQIQEDPLPLSNHVKIAPAIEQIVMQALAKDPGKRQQTASALARALAAAAAAAAPAEDSPAFDASTATTDFIPVPPVISQAGHQLSEITAMRPQGAAFASGEIKDSALQPTVVNRVEMSGGHQSLLHSTPPARQNKRQVQLLGVVAVAAFAVIAALGGYLYFGQPQTEKSGSQAGMNGPAGSQTGKAAKNQGSGQTDGVPAESTEPPAGMVYVGGGAFTMGPDEQEHEDGIFKSPAHKVSVKPYFMDIYEVTRENYKKFVDATGYAPPKSWSGNSFPSGTARFPVTDVNWDAANAYAKWAGKRLPTESEWEFAARGNDGRLYPWGNDWKDGMANANKVNSGLVEVGIYKGASPFGIYDMIGNAWEWTATTLEPYPQGSMPDLPKTQIPEIRIIRGGTWSNEPRVATAARRGFWGARNEKNYSNTGFRCVKDIQ